MRYGLVCFSLILTLATLAKAQTSPRVSTTTPDSHYHTVAYLGVAISAVERLDSIKTGLPVGVGLRVEWVDTHTITAKHIQKGDILHKLNNQLLISAKQLQVLVGMHKPGDAIEVTRWRDGKAAQVTLHLGQKQYGITLPDTPHHPTQAQHASAQGAITTVSAKQNIRCTLEYRHNTQRFLVHGLDDQVLKFDTKALPTLTEKHIPAQYLGEYKKIRTLEPHVRPGPGKHANPVHTHTSSATAGH